MISFKEKRICQAAILHIVDVFSPFDNNTQTSSNALIFFPFFQFVFIFDFENLQICIENYGLTKSSEVFIKYLSPQIALKNGSVLKTDLWMSGFKTE